MSSELPWQVVLALYSQDGGKRIPWRAMLSSSALLAALLGNVSTCTVAALLSTYLPTYFKQVLFLDITSVCQSLLGITVIR